jgi:hypothetical protein
MHLKKWSGGDENYMLTTKGSTTTLTVEMIGDFGDWEDHLNTSYPIQERSHFKAHNCLILQAGTGL